MGFARYSKTLWASGQHYLQDMRAGLSVELLFALPLLIWAYLGTAIFYDAFRAKMQSEAAAMHVADVISRNTNEITVAYLEGMNDVFDFLTSSARETRLRISSVMLNTDTGEPQIAWSHGTRGLAPLSTITSTSGAAEGGTGFGSAENQAPIEHLERRIPTILPGEALILVETFALWKSPLKSLMGLPYLDDVRLAPLAVTRPRFAPFIRFENDNAVYPSPPMETPPPIEEPETPAEPEQPPTEQPTNITLTEQNFMGGVPPGWTNATVNSGPNYNFLGPFGGGTRYNPVTFRSQSPHPLLSKRIEFELLVIGSWDGLSPWNALPEGEVLLIQINGESIALDPFHFDRPPMLMNSRNTMAFRADGQFHTHMHNIWNTDSAPGHNGQRLQVWKVVITVVSPASDMTIGFAANLDEGVNNESFGIRDFRITAERLTLPQQPNTPRPDPTTFVGRDLYTDFPLHNACPKVLSSAPSYTIQQTDLWAQSFRSRVWARGARDISTCPGFSGLAGFVHEAPTAVLNWVGQGNNTGPWQLTIQTDDGNQGNTCNSALLVRDAYGQWHYNRDRFAWDKNAAIFLGYAGTGPHYIWVLREGGSACGTTLRVQRH